MLVNFQIFAFSPSNVGYTCGGGFDGTDAVLWRISVLLAHSWLMADIDSSKWRRNSVG